MTEYFETSSKKGRGRAQKSRDLIEAMRAIAEAVQPVTGRGVGYKLFTQGLIESMARSVMQRVYRLLKLAREEGIIPWEWIVDETRAIEPGIDLGKPHRICGVRRHELSARLLDQQPHRVQVWSEKGTVRGLLAPVLDHYAVGFLPVHWFASATIAHDIAEDDDGRDLVVLYVSDFDPSGLFMSEEDLPARFAQYDGDHIELRRIALTPDQVQALPSFLAADKRRDPRYRWFTQNYGDRCWELDAMDPNDLRDCVQREIRKLIEPVAWARCEVVNKAEMESLRTILANWPGAEDAP
jgi:hypothetical protein